MLLIIAIVLHLLAIIVNPLIGIRSKKLMNTRVTTGYICTIAACVLYVMSIGWMGLIIQPALAIPLFCISWGINKLKNAELDYNQFLIGDTSNEVIILNGVDIV